MKVTAINGSPRKKWNTGQLLENALNGAKSVGAETELVNLYDLSYKGCISCFGCKHKGAALCHCYLKDDLSPVLEMVLQSDVLLLGSPIYFGNITGEMRSFLERLAFITMSYDDYSAQIFQGHIDSAFFFTMNVGKNYKSMYEPMMQETVSMLGRLGALRNIMLQQTHCNSMITQNTMLLVSTKQKNFPITSCSSLKIKRLLLKLVPD